MGAIQMLFSRHLLFAPSILPVYYEGLSPPSSPLHVILSLHTDCLLCSWANIKAHVLPQLPLRLFFTSQTPAFSPPNLTSPHSVVSLFNILLLNVHLNVSHFAFLYVFSGYSARVLVESDSLSFSSKNAGVYSVSIVLVRCQVSQKSTHTRWHTESTPLL